MKPTKDNKIKAASAHTGSFLAHSAMLRILFDEITGHGSPGDQLKLRTKLLQKGIRMMALMPLDGVDKPDLVRVAGTEEVNDVFGTSQH